MGDEIGSLEVGKRADIVRGRHDRPEPGCPRSPDPVLQLVWATDGRAVRHVVASGRVVVRDGRCTTVDVDGARRAAGAPGTCRPPPGSIRSRGVVVP